MMEAYITSSDVETCVVALKVSCDKCHSQTCSFFSFTTNSFLIKGKLMAGLILDFPRLMSYAEGNVN